MKYSTLLFAAATLVASLSAQTTMTLPPGFETTDGEVHSNYLGYYASQRIQHADGEIPRSLALITQADYRLDLYREYTSVTGMGRTWTRTTLTMSGCDVTKLSGTFSLNPIGTPRKVFDAKVTWPTVTGLITSAPWGKQVSFPFGTAYIHDGKTDILFDFTFEGGTLANNDSAWTGIQGRSYYLDMIPSDDFLDPPQRIFVPSISFASIPNCKDAKSTLTGGSYSTMTGAVYGTNYKGTSGAPDSFAVKISSYGHAPNSAVIEAICYGGSMTGVNVGATCNKLHVDLSRQLLTLFKTSDNGGSTLVTPITGRYDGKLAGLYMWIQAAWTNSGTGQLGLTETRRVTLPKVPYILNKRCIYEASATASMGYSTSAVPSGVWYSYWRQGLPLLTKK